MPKYFFAFDNRCRLLYFETWFLQDICWQKWLGFKVSIQNQNCACSNDQDWESQRVTPPRNTDLSKTHLYFNILSASSVMGRIGPFCRLVSVVRALTAIKHRAGRDAVCSPHRPVAWPPDKTHWRQKHKQTFRESGKHGTRGREKSQFGNYLAVITG